MKKVRGVTKQDVRGVTKYMTEYRLDGKRARRFFDTKGAAELHLKSIKNDRAGAVAKLHALPDDVKIDLLNAYLRAEKNGYNIHNACAEYEKSPECLPTLSFEAARDRFIAGKKLKNLRPRSIKTYESTFNHVGMTFDDYDLNQNAKVDFQDWLLDQGFEPKTVNNYIGHLNTLRNWIAKQNFEVGRFNPFDIEKIEIDADDPEIFAIEDVEPYLRAAIQVPEVGLIVVLVLLCGLRVSEAIHTTPKEFKLDKETPTVTVRGAAAKKRQRRIIEITPNAVAWLKAAMAAGCVQPATEAQFIKARKSAKLQTAANVMRHSFCSYHVARFKNKNETAQAAGNSPQMIDEFYRELVAPEDAEKFFSIMP